MTVDASNVPNEYALAILSECMTFPRRLVFFLKGYLTVQLPDIDMPAILPDTDMTTSVFSQQYTLPSLEASGLTLKVPLAVHPAALQIGRFQHGTGLHPQCIGAMDPSGIRMLLDVKPVLWPRSLGCRGHDLKAAPCLGLMPFQRQPAREHGSVSSFA